MAGYSFWKPEIQRVRPCQAELQFGGCQIQKDTADDLPLRDSRRVSLKIGDPKEGGWFCFGFLL